MTYRAYFNLQNFFVKLRVGVWVLTQTKKAGIEPAFC